MFTIGAAELQSYRMDHFYKLILTLVHRITSIQALNPVLEFELKAFGIVNPAGIGRIVDFVSRNHSSLILTFNVQHLSKIQITET